MTENTGVPMTPRQRLAMRWGALKLERSSWMLHWAELSAYCLPRSGRYFVNDRNKGTKRHNAIYDNTATRAVQILGAGMMSGATSPARPWFKLQSHDPELMSNKAVKQWMADVTQLILTVFAKSNTYRALHSIYEELGTFGTAACVVMEDYENVIHLMPLTAGEYAIATDFKGNVDSLYREFQKTVGDVVDEFGYENCSVATRNLYDTKAFDKWITVVHAIEPRKDREYDKLDAKNMPYASCYYELNAQGDQLLRESGYQKFYVLAPRWATSGGDIYGNSPAMTALGDIKQLQHQQLRKAECIDLQTKPPLQAPASLKNAEVRLIPGGITYADSSGPSGSIRSIYEVQLNLEHLARDMEEVRQRINSAFYVDMFLMLANDTRSGVTATEVAERHEEKLLMLGPVLERLHNELLQPLVDITFDRLMEAGVIPEPPEELHGQDLNVEFVSILAQAQKAVATAGVDKFVGNLGAIAQFKPEILDKFDADVWADQYSEMLGIDPKLVLDADEVAAIRQQRAQAQQQAQQTALAEQQAKTAQALGNTPTKGNTSTALDDVMQGLQGYSTPQAGLQ